MAKCEISFGIKDMQFHLAKNPERVQNKYSISHPGKMYSISQTVSRRDDLSL
jgi:hypothetical protein